MTIRGMLFDIDDTLFDYTSSEHSAVVGHLTAEGLLGRFPSPEAAVARWRDIMEEEYARFLAGEVTFKEQQRLRTARFLGELGIEAEDPDAWFAGYAARRNEKWSAFPDAAPALEALAGRYRLGLISNSSIEHQRGKLSAIGLSGFFEESVILCSHEYGCAKPDPRIFVAGCELLGMEPGEVAYVGDKYDVDALGAKAAGLRAYWLDRKAGGTHVEEGITVITSLAELV
ncbi:HAD family hydrolase [Nonomuraea sp. NPDC050328]|uniref:HAD family hydrolase n=1 Tax=Nonomuraea sp. NPDC050328 TaxID=3364361 RepID=UPI00379ADCEC